MKIKGLPCKAKFKKHGSTTRMNDHLRSVHDMKQFKTKTILKREFTDFTKTLLCFIISSASPLSIVENGYLKSLLSKLSYTLPPRQILKEFLNNLHEEIFTEIYDKLGRAENIAVTADGWTAKYQKKSYIGLTAHYLDENFGINSLNLGVYQVNAHDAFSTATIVENKMNLFTIFEKVNYMTTDNAAVMAKAAKKINKELIGCFESSSEFNC